jgi:ABC-type transport system involved in multi-copper enzyme maturation permease subunit
MNSETMVNLVRAEVIKLTSTRSWWILLLLGALLTLLLALPVLLLSGIGEDENGQPAAQTAFSTSESVLNLFSGMSAAGIMALIFGILSVTGEFRHKTITDTFLTEPRRPRVLIAKAVVVCGYGAVLAVVAVVTNTIAVLAVLTSQEHAAIPWVQVLLAAATVILGFCLYALVGLGFGAFVTSQVAALVLALLWVLLVEPLIGGLRPEIGEWLPGGALVAVTQWQLPGTENLLPGWLGVLTLVAYALGFAAVATATTLRRDIT